MSAPSETQAETLAVPSAGAERSLEPLRDLLCLAAPFLLLFFAPSGSGAAVASVFAALLIPGLCLLRLVLPPGHPWRELHARLGVTTALALVPFGLAAAVSTKLHWTFQGFLVLYGVLAGALFLAALVSGERAAPPRVVEPFPARTARPGAGLLAAVLLVLGLLAASRGDSRRFEESWLLWTLAGAGLGVVAALLALRCTGGARRAGAEDGSEGDRWLRLLLWAGVALVTWYLMAVAYERRSGDDDDTTYVSRAVDLVSGEPMDRFEPSLGEPVPVNPGFVLATTSMLDGVVAWTTGVSASAAHKTYLPPLLALAGVSALAALVGLLVRGDRVLLPLSLLVLLCVLAASSDRHRSLTHFLFHRALQPKSVHFAVLAPLQLGVLVLLARAPGGRTAALAALLVLAGHLVHPWSTVLCGVWGGAFVLAALVGAGRAAALRAVLPALVAVLSLGLFHYLDATHNLFGPAVESKVDAPYVSELVAARGIDGVRLDGQATVGGYSFYRLGILCVPWLLVLALWLRETRVVLAGALVALALSFVEPVARFATLALPLDLMWRNRLMLPAAAAIVAATAVLYTLLAGSARGAGAGRRAGAWAGALATVGLGVLVALALPSKVLRRDGPVTEPSKISGLTRAVVAATGGPEGAPYLLAPTHSDVQVELTQLQSDARLVLVRPLIFDWAFGRTERQRRTRMLKRFEEGRMTPKGFRELRAEFPVDWALLDTATEGAENTRALLRRAGWTLDGSIGTFELWRLDTG
jgi:hypothetical protein